MKVTAAQIFEHLGGPAMTPLGRLALRSVIRTVMAGGEVRPPLHRLHRAVVSAKRDLERPVKRGGRR